MPLEFSRLFAVFSRRNQDREPIPKPLTPGFRNRVLMLCRDVFGDPARSYLAEDIVGDFWREIHHKLAYLHGRPKLTDDSYADSAAKDVIAFLTTCSDNHFLDFVEYLFQVESYQRACSEANQAVESINQFLLLDDLPYAVTPFVWEDQKTEFHGVTRDCRVMVSHPRVIRRDDEIVHREAIEPALHLLADKRFTSANQEFLDGLADFRKGDYGDCLTKCGSALESTMKLICDRNGWPYQQRDTAATLLRTIIARSGMEGFLEQPLLLVANLRNRLSKSHGAGTEPRMVSPAKARFAINATAAAILFLVEENC